MDDIDADTKEKYAQMAKLIKDCKLRGMWYVSYLKCEFLGTTKLGDWRLRSDPLSKAGNREGP